MKHVYAKCKQPCETPNCMICDGGLAFCTACRCGEGTLPTECPGYPVPEHTQDAIMDGVTDYVGGEWIEKKKPKTKETS